MTRVLGLIRGGIAGLVHLTLGRGELDRTARGAGHGLIVVHLVVGFFVGTLATALGAFGTGRGLGTVVQGRLGTDGDAAVRAAPGIDIPLDAGLRGIQGDSRCERRTDSDFIPCRPGVALGLRLARMGGQHLDGARTGTERNGVTVADTRRGVIDGQGDRHRRTDRNIARGAGDYRGFHAVIAGGLHRQTAGIGKESRVFDLGSRVIDPDVQSERRADTEAGALIGIPAACA